MIAGIRVLVTGATGYVGGRLAPHLVARGHRVRCLTRSAGRLRDVPWATDVESVEGDVAGRAAPSPPTSASTRSRAEMRLPGRAWLELTP